MRRTLPILLSIALLTACGAPPTNPVTPEPTFLYPTSTPAATVAIAPTALANVYAENIHLFEYEADSPVPVTEESVQQEDDYTVHDIHYPSPIAGDVPA